MFRQSQHDKNEKLIAIVGPTASGKTQLSLKIAQHYNGEIICADSRTVYREMDIGTAKPDKNQQKLIKHHCIDLVDPDGEYNAKMFQDDAKAAIESIVSRGKIPIIVGGTGLYINSLIYQYNFATSPDLEQRKALDKLSLDDLGKQLKIIDPEAPGKVDIGNRRRVIRAIENAGKIVNSQPKSTGPYLLIGLNPGKTILSKIIAQRTKDMLKQGLIDEATQIAKKYGNCIEPLNTVGYKQALLCDEGKISLEQTEEQVNIKTWQLARRQMTWFKRDKNITWFKNIEQAQAWISPQKLYRKP